MSQISRIELFCDDRKVGEVLRLVAGVAIGQPSVQPVVNAENKDGQLKAESSGDKIALFRKWLAKKKLAEVNSDLGREFCKSVGSDPESYNYLFGKARDLGLLRKVGKGTHSRWKVTL